MSNFLCTLLFSQPSWNTVIVTILAEDNKAFVYHQSFAICNVVSFLSNLRKASSLPRVPRLTSFALTFHHRDAVAALPSVSFLAARWGVRWRSPRSTWSTPTRGRACRSLSTADCTGCASGCVATCAARGARPARSHSAPSRGQHRAPPPPPRGASPTHRTPHPHRTLLTA